MEADRGLDRLKENLQRIFADQARLRGFVKQKDKPAQVWLDRMQQLAEHPKTSPELRSSIFKTILRLSRNSGLHPTCLMIQNVRKLGDYPIAAGGFGDVWKGVIGESTEPVCLKIVKIYQNSDVEKLSTEYIREALVWRQLKHPNLLPFLGIYHLEHTHQLCLISPWMEKGNLIQYLKSTAREEVDHSALVRDVAAGLGHLHSMKIVHGDLKGVNVLMTDSGRARIGDFGLSRVAETHGLQVTTSTFRPAGTGRWLAPELLTGGVTSKESDVYAFGCVCFEIFTGTPPFPELPNEMAVAMHVLQGKRMTRPEYITELKDDMWAVMDSCWNIDPSGRPSANDIISKIKPNSRHVDEGSDWSDHFTNEIWNNVEHQTLDKISTDDEASPRLGYRGMTDVEPDPYLTIKIITDETFTRHDGFDLALLEENICPPSNLPTFRVPRTESVSALKIRAGQFFGFMEHHFRLWMITSRYYGIFRPYACINTSDPLMTVDHVRKFLSTRELGILVLYLDVFPRHYTMSPFGLVNGTDTSKRLPTGIMLFLKHYDSSKHTIRGIGKIYMSETSAIADLVPIICKHMLWNETEIRLFEEAKPGLVVELCLEYSFQEAELGDGDIICFERLGDEPKAYDLRAQCLNLNIRKFYDSLYNDPVVITFRPWMEERAQGDSDFSLIFHKEQDYDTLAAKVGQHLGYDPLRLRFMTTHSARVVQKPVMRALNQTVAEIVHPYGDEGPVLLYEKLGISIVELETSRRFEVIWLPVGMRNVGEETHSVVLSKTLRVRDMAEVLSKKVKLTPGGTGEICIFEVWRDMKNTRQDYAGVKLISEIPADPVDLYAEEVILPPAEPYKYPNSNIRNFGRSLKKLLSR